MRRRSVVYALIVGTAVFGQGCASAWRGDSLAPLAWMGPRHQKSGDKDAAEDKEPNPFQSTVASANGNSKETTPPESHPKPPNGVDTSQLVASHDAETLKLINEELKDATPEEREQWFKDFKGVDPQMVRPLLRMRRMVVKMSPEAVGDSAVVTASAEKPAGPADGGGSPSASGELAAGASERDSGFGHTRQGQLSASAPSYSGLGNSSPWGDSAAEQRPTGTMASTAGAASQSAHYAPTPPYRPQAMQQSGMASPESTTDPRTSATPTPNYRGEQVVSAGASGSFGAPQQAMSVTPPTAYAGPPSGAGMNRRPTSAVPAAVTAEAERGNTLMPATFTGGIATGAQHAIADMTAGFGASLVPIPGAIAPSGLDQDLERVIASMEAQVAELSPGSSEEEALKYIQRHVFLRVLYLMSGQQERALTAVPGIGAADQEFWQQVLWSVTNYFDAKAIPDPVDRATQTIAQLNAAVQRLQENAKLEVPTAAFCKKIMSYGDYEKLERDEFRPGQPVLLYTEVRNFKSEPTADWKYRTVLRSWVDIHKYRADGQADLIESTKFPVSEDACRNQRRDYFLSYEFSIPQRISPGPHVLKLFVEDVLNQKIATYSLNFTVN